MEMRNSKLSLKFTSYLVTARRQNLAMSSTPKTPMTPATTIASDDDHGLCCNSFVHYADFWSSPVGDGLKRFVIQPFLIGASAAVGMSFGRASFTFCDISGYGLVDTVGKLFKKRS